MAVTQYASGTMSTPGLAVSIHVRLCLPLNEASKVGKQVVTLKNLKLATGKHRICIWILFSFIYRISNYSGRQSLAGSTDNNNKNSTTTCWVSTTSPYHIPYDQDWDRDFRLPVVPTEKLVMSLGQTFNQSLLWHEAQLGTVLCTNWRCMMWSLTIHSPRQ